MGDINWRQYHHRYIILWNNRHNFVVQGESFRKSGHLRDNSPYMQWYINHIICYISPVAQSSDDEMRIFYFWYFINFNFYYYWISNKSINCCSCISMTCLNNITIHLHISSFVRIDHFLASFTHKIRLQVMEIGIKECNLHHLLIRSPLRTVFFPP